LNISNRRSSPLDTHDHDGSGYTPEQRRRLHDVRARIIEARRELDALIGDAYLRPRASIVPVHFLDLAAAVEKLRWAEKEWRELDRGESGAGSSRPGEFDDLVSEERVKSSVR
jgi:hypothetical protein